ncbi:MAG: GPP34 family phosphoprotein [Bacteroidales bacterium]|nr:GPP34 family phosphoprotein [Bacteroidales bacterium]
MDNAHHLYEEILLLALRDKEGTVFYSTQYKFALAGAIMAELLLDEKITLTGTGKRKFVEAATSKPLSDSILNDSLEKIRNARRRATLETWVRRVSETSGLKNKAALQLCRKGILKLEESRVLFFFRQKKYPEINPKPEQELIKRLHRAIFSDEKEVSPRTVVLISIANATGLLKANFDKKELRSRKERIKKITEGEHVGEAAKKAIEAMQAAIMVAVVIPAVIASTAAT